MKNLLLPERSVLECLKYRSEINYLELCKLTGFNQKFLLGIIKSLEVKGLIEIYSENKITINYDNIKKKQSDKNLKLDITDLFEDIVSDFFNKKKSIISFSMKSYWMNSFERKLLDTKISDLEKFLNTLNHSKGSLEFKKRVLVGTQICDYNSLAVASMENLT